MSSEDRGGQDGIISLLAGIGVGALIGAAVALLVAPQSGEQTRAQLRETADDAIGKLRESMDELRHKVDEVAATTRQALGRREGATGDVLGGDVAGATDETTGTGA